MAENVVAAAWLNRMVVVKRGRRIKCRNRHLDVRHVSSQYAQNIRSKSVDYYTAVDTLATFVRSRDVITHCTYAAITM